MRIVHIITGLSRGGAEAMLVKLLTTMDRDSVENHVISLTDGGVYGDKISSIDVPLQCIGMRRGVPTPAAWLRLRRLVRAAAPDLVHGWMYHGMFAGLMAAGGRPMIAAVRHSLYGIADEKPFTRLVMRGCAAASGTFTCIAYNSRIAMDQHEAFGFSPERATVIPNGFDTMLLCPNPESRVRMRVALGIGEEQVAVLHLARLHPMKDHAGLLAAIARMDDPRLVFLLAGTGVSHGNPPFDGTLDPRIRLLGERDDVQDLLQAADMLVNSSWSEAFPNVLGEAMACGVPCVATDVGDSAFILGGTGIVVPPRDPAALSDAILRMAALDPAARQALGHRARVRVVEHFSIGSVARAYETLYETVLEERVRAER